VIELLLFLGTFCLLFFVPVQFEIIYRNENWRARMVAELSFLNGLLKRKTEIRLHSAPTEMKKTTVNEGRWFWLKKRTSRTEVTSQSDSIDFIKIFTGLRQSLERYRHFGLGITLLTYFLPARYHRWILVAENLEKRGTVRQLSWLSRVGTGDPVLTALFTGILWGAQETLVGYLQSRYYFVKPPEVTVSGDFQSSGWDTAFNCIFRVKLGYIMIAALIVRFRHSWRKGGVGSE
jgi:hypothetical protein